VTDGRFSLSMLPAEDRHDVSSADQCLYVQRPPAYMGGHQGAVSVFERECSSAAHDSAEVIKTHADVSRVSDYFYFERKTSLQSGCELVDDVVWTHHYEGVDVPGVELPQDTTHLLRQWWTKFAAEQKAKCDEQARLKEMKKIEADIAYLQAHSASGSLIKTNGDGRTLAEESKMPVEEEKRIIQKQESEVKEKREQAHQLAAAAKEKDRKEEIEIAKQVDLLKHERVSVQILFFMPYALTSHQDAAALARSVGLQQEKKQQDIIDQKRHEEQLEKARASKDIAAAEKLERETVALIDRKRENDIQTQHQLPAKAADREKEGLGDKKEASVAEEKHATLDKANGASNQNSNVKGQPPLVDKVHEPQQSSMEKSGVRVVSSEEAKRKEEDRGPKNDEQASAESSR
jgi:hypothetical protein